MFVLLPVWIGITYLINLLWIDSAGVFQKVKLVPELTLTKKRTIMYVRTDGEE